MVTRRFDGLHGGFRQGQLQRGDAQHVQSVGVGRVRGHGKAIQLGRSAEIALLMKGAARVIERGAAAHASGTVIVSARDLI